MSRLTLLSALMIILTACGSKSPVPEQNGAPTRAAATVAHLTVPLDSIYQIQIPADTQQSYMLYVPHGVKEPATVPVIVFFDPHGAGRLPVEKYHKLADRFGIVLAGSNNSRNGQQAPESDQIANHIITDLSTRIGLNTHNICLAGFSGGAKVALSTAINNSNINSAIYSGASIPFNPTHPVHLLGFAGTEDMNYSDLLGFSEIMDHNSPGMNHLIEYSGKHEWPDTSVFRDAFYWLYFRSGVKDNVQLNQYIRAFKSQEELQIMVSNATKHYQNMLWALNTYDDLIYILQGVADVSGYKKKKDELVKDKFCQLALEEKRQALQKEGSAKQTLLAAFQNQDGNWWTKTIKAYKSSPAASDKRLLGFVSLACFSYSGQLLTRGDTANAARILAIYELADPDNTDQLYFHAILYSMENKGDVAMRYLSKAVDKGFKDVQRIETDPALTPLRGLESFSRLVTSLKKGSK